MDDHQPDLATADGDALRHDVGAVWLGRDVVLVQGPEALSFLQGQLSQDVAALAVGESRWSFLLQPQGKVDAWLRVTRTRDDAAILDVDDGWGEAVTSRLDRFKLRTPCTIEPLDWQCLAVRGPNASGVAPAAPPTTAPC